MILLTICNTPEDVVSTKHICYYAKSEGPDIVLYEVVEVCYKHPQAPEDAVVPVIEVHVSKKVKKVDPEAAAWILLEASEKSVGWQKCL